MKVKVTFEYDEQSRLWEVFVTGASSSEEAIQAFNAVVLTCHQTKDSMFHKAVHQITPDMHTYKLSICANP